MKMSDNDKNRFSYSYSAPSDEERREIENIKSRYSERAETKDNLTRLRELDAKVYNLPMAVAISLGVIGILIFGLGLTMILEWKILVWGIIVMAAGVVVMAPAKPVYDWLLKRNKKKYGAEILKLSDELLNESEKK